jgi:hypothetical protein
MRKEKSWEMKEVYTKVPENIQLEPPYSISQATK